MNVSSFRGYIFAGALLCAAAFAPAASAQVYITEWMYNGNGTTGEYIEFTNLGSTAVDSRRCLVAAVWCGWLGWLGSQSETSLATPA